MNICYISPLYILRSLLTLGIICLLFPLLGQYALPVKEWDRDFGGTIWEELNSIQQTTDEGYIMAGFSSSSATGDVQDLNQGNGDFWVVKIDRDGNLIWEQNYGGTELDRARAIRQTSDGGYIVGGWAASGASGDKGSPSEGLDDFWILKINATGGIEWERSYGGDGTDQLYDLIQTSDGGYLVGGNSNSSVSGQKTAAAHGNLDWWVLKLDASGNIQWQQSYGGSEEERFSEIEETADGHFLLAGGSSSPAGGDVTLPLIGVKDFYLLKVDRSNGSIIWERRYGGTNEEDIGAVSVLSDGGFLVGGSSRSDINPGIKTDNSRGLVDMWILKLDDMGQRVWDKTFSGMGANAIQNCYSVKENSIGNYLIGGFSNADAGFDKRQDSKGAYDFWLIYTDPDGNKLWDMTIGGDQNDVMENVFQTSDGGYLLAGHSSTDVNQDKTEASKGLNDFWIVKTRCDLTLNIPDIDVCPGEPFILDAYDAQCLACEWTWDDGSTDSIRTLSLDQSRNFRVTLTDAVGCARFADVRVNVFSGPQLDLGPDLSSCTGQSFQLDAGAGFQSYNWSGGEIDRMITVDGSGLYIVTVTDNDGCTAVDSIEIFSATSFTIDLGPDTTICENGSLQLDAGIAGLNYAWSNNTILQTTTINNAGEYSVTVSDGSGCMAVDTILVSEYIEPEVTSVMAVCNEDNNAYVVSFIILGGDPSTYSVTGHAGTIQGSLFESIEIPISQPYRLMVTDARACAPLEVSGTHDCNCTSTAGVLEPGPHEFCVGETIEISLTDQAILDANDVAQYILHDGTSTMIGNIEGLFSSSSFDPPAGLVPGQTYFLTMIVGNNDGSGAVNPVDGCRSESIGVPVIVSESPEAIAIVQGPQTLTCDQDRTVLDGSSSQPLGQVDFQWNTADGNILGDVDAPLATANAKGTYRLIVTNQGTSCADTTEIFIDATDDRPEIQIAAVEELTCVDTLVSIDATGSTTGSTIDYLWTGPGITGSDNQLIITVDQPGPYTLLINNTANNCSASRTIQVSQDIEPPFTHAGEKPHLDCIDGTLQLNGSSLPTDTVTHFWYTFNGNIVEGERTLEPIVDQVGTYYLVNTDVNSGCVGIDSTIIYPNETGLSEIRLDVRSPACFEEGLGRLQILDVIGLDPPYLFSLDGENFSPIRNFEDLAPGSYTLFIQDANGCIEERDFRIRDSNSFALSINFESLIQLGDSTMLRPQTNAQIDTFYWIDQDGLSCTDCWNPLVKPTETTAYELVVIDENGCLKSTYAIVNVEKKRLVYIPTAFSPNGDGTNDHFTVFAGSGVAKIHSFRVFDRWGELVFETNSLTPNNELEGWNGEFNGKMMDSGVFVYYAEIEFTDGWKEIYQGDVTLVK